MFLSFHTRFFCAIVKCVVKNVVSTELTEIHSIPGRVSFFASNGLEGFPLCVIQHCQCPNGYPDHVITSCARVSNSYDQPQLPSTKMATAENGETKQTRISGKLDRALCPYDTDVSVSYHTMYFSYDHVFQFSWERKFAPRNFQEVGRNCQTLLIVTANLTPSQLIVTASRWS